MSETKLTCLALARAFVKFPFFREERVAYPFESAYQ